MKKLLIISGILFGSAITVSAQSLKAKPAESPTTGVKPVPTPVASTAKPADKTVAPKAATAQKPATRTKPSRPDDTQTSFKAPATEKEKEN